MLRNREKKELIEALTGLADINGLIDEVWKKNEYEELGNILVTAQQSVIEIGTWVESRCSDGIQGLIGGFENYCEILYKISQVENETDYMQAYLLLLASYDTIMSEARLLDIAPLKVVFMPYKASMWDCMETVWEAAVKDSSCKVAVVPIPFYEKEADGSAHKLCYEGNLMPKKVKITNYKNYDIEKELPDIVYIHNPYDGMNIVTSVHPDYYSDRLKKYTDMLVYIPYFALAAFPKEHKILPAYRNVDKIITVNKTQEEALLENYTPEKILTVGSPKVERVMKLQLKRKEILDNEIPQEWRDKLRGKKAILLNLSVSGLLHNNNAFEKLNYIIDEFEKREDLVLLWRPHPLIEATLNSMRGDLYSQYRQLNKRIRKLPNAIHDTTPDPAMSAVISDAYIGEDTSSIVTYFGVLGKPCYYINWKLTAKDIEEAADKTIFFSEAYIEDGYMWFVPRSKLGSTYLCRMKLGSNIVEPMIELIGEIANERRAWGYFGMVKVGDMVVLSHINGKDIYMLDIKTGDAARLLLRESVDGIVFGRMSVYKDKIYIYPSGHTAIVEIDSNTKRIKHHPVHSDGIYPSETPMAGNGIMIGSKLYCPCANRNAIVIYDVDSGEYTDKILSQVECGIAGLALIDDRLWIIGYRCNRLYSWNIENDCIEEYVCEEDGFIGGVQPYYRVVKYNDRLYMIPNHGNMIFRIDEKAHKLICVKEIYLSGKEDKEWASDVCPNSITYVNMLNNELYVATITNGSIHRINPETGECISNRLTLAEDSLKKLEIDEYHQWFDKCAMPNILWENLTYPIDRYMDYIISGRYNYHKKVQNAVPWSYGKDILECGNEIHTRIKKEYIQK